MKKLTLALLVVCATSLAHAKKPEVQCSSQTRRTVSKEYVPRNIEKIKVAFFDADSTLRISIKGGLTPENAADVMILPHMGQRLRELAADNYLIYIVSNQGGIQMTHSNCDDAEKALLHTIELIERDGGVVHGYDFAENYDEVYRKPAIGMATMLEKALQDKFCDKTSADMTCRVAIDKTQSIMVGDSAFNKKTDFMKTGPDGNRVAARQDEEGAVPGTHHSNADRLFAQNYGVQFIEAAVFFGWRKNGIDVFENVKQLETYLKTYKD